MILQGFDVWAMLAVKHLSTLQVNLGAGTGSYIDDDHLRYPIAIMNINVMTLAKLKE
jgi:hypothetical protein